VKVIDDRASCPVYRNAHRTGVNVIKTRFVTAAVAVSCLLLVAAGCGDDDDDSASTTASEEVTSADQGTTSVASESSAAPGTIAPGTTEPGTTTESGEKLVLRTRVSTDPTGWDPLLAATPAEQIGGTLMYERLINASPDGKGITNILVDTWEPSDDGLTIDFTLKKGIQFHKGYGELTMDDVKFSLERFAGITYPESGFASFWAALKSIDIIDSHTGRFVFSEPSVSIVSQQMPITPIFSKKAWDELGSEGFAQNPVGSGPYELKETVPGEHATFSAFADYGGAQPWVPERRFDEITFQVIGEDSAAELAFEGGDLDLLAPMRAAAVSRFEGLDNTTVDQATTMIYRFIGMNVTDPDLADPNLRKAIIAAIDVPSIIDATSEGKDTRATAIVAPSSPIGYWADAPVHDQDLDAARAFMAEVPEGNRHFKFTVVNDEISRTIAQIVQANLAEIGLDIEIESLDPAAYWVTGDPIKTRQMFYQEGGINYREPTQELVWFTCDHVVDWNWQQWCDEEYSSLFDQVQSDLDPSSRQQTYEQMQQIWDEAANTVWISHPTAFIASRSDKVSLTIDPSGTLYWTAVTPVAG
jgi:peptide/nickel transport system substrate-binding protein